MPTSIIVDRCKELVPVEYEDKSSPAKYYMLPNAMGRVGLINPISCKFCSNCNRIRVTADGKLKTCLHSDDEHDIRQFDDRDSLKKSIVNAIMKKPKEHHLEDGDYIKRNMMKIGG